MTKNIDQMSDPILETIFCLFASTSILVCSVQRAELRIKRQNAFTK